MSMSSNHKVVAGKTIEELREWFRDRQMSSSAFWRMIGFLEAIDYSVDFLVNYGSQYTSYEEFREWIGPIYKLFFADWAYNEE